LEQKCLIEESRWVKNPDTGGQTMILQSAILKQDSIKRGDVVKLKQVPKLLSHNLLLQSGLVLAESPKR